jgi:WD40 repeat protein
MNEIIFYTYVINDKKNSLFNKKSFNSNFSNYETQNNTLSIHLMKVKKIDIMDPIISSNVTNNYLSNLLYDAGNSNNNYKNSFNTNQYSNNNGISNYNCFNNAKKDLFMVNTSKIHASINLYDLSDFSLINKYYGHTQTQFVIKCCFGGLNNEYILSGSEDSKIYIWHIRSSIHIFAINGHTGPINSINMPDFGVTLSCSDDHTIRIWTNFNVNYFDISHEKGRRRLNSINSVGINIGSNDRNDDENNNGNRDGDGSSVGETNINLLEPEESSYGVNVDENFAFPIDQNIIGDTENLEEEEEELDDDFDVDEENEEF